MMLLNYYCLLKREHKTSLRYPMMPCLHLGSINKTIYIPVEFCTMESQPLPRYVFSYSDQNKTNVSPLVPRCKVCLSQKKDLWVLFFDFKGGGYDILGVNIKKGFLKEFVQFTFFPIVQKTIPRPCIKEQKLCKRT